MCACTQTHTHHSSIQLLNSCSMFCTHLKFGQILVGSVSALCCVCYDSLTEVFNRNHVHEWQSNTGSQFLLFTWASLGAV